MNIYLDVSRYKYQEAIMESPISTYMEIRKEMVMTGYYGFSNIDIPYKYKRIWY